MDNAAIVEAIRRKKAERDAKRAALREEFEAMKAARSGGRLTVAQLQTLFEQMINDEGGNAP